MDEDLLTEFAPLPTWLWGGPESGAEGGAEAPEEVRRRVDRIGHHLAADRSRFMDALHSPFDTVNTVNKHYGLGPVLQWIAWCWIAEALWRVIAQPSGDAAPGFTALERQILFPVAARHRFLALAEAYRRGSPPGAADAAEHVYGDGSVGLYLEHSVESRRTWTEILEQHGTYQILGVAEHAELEAETDLLMFDSDHPGPLLRMSHNQLLSLARGERGGALTGEDRWLAHELTERHLLPTLRIVAAFRGAIATCDSRHGGPSAVVLVLVAAVALALAALSPWAPQLWRWPTLTFSAGVALTCYLGGVVGVAVFGRMWAIPWLLRMPAAAAIGLLMLAAMHPTWWQEVLVERDGGASLLRTLWPALLLGGFAYGYLVVTARNNGLKVGASAWRALLVWAIGGVHAALISLIALTWIIPLFGQDGDLLARLWADGGGAALVVVAQSAAWCLFAGVVVQILWDDRPITAPLTHTRWDRKR